MPPEWPKWVDERTDAKIACLKCGKVEHGLAILGVGGIEHAMVEGKRYDQGVCEPCMRRHMDGVPCVKPKCKKCGKPYYPWAAIPGPYFNGADICEPCAGFVFVKVEQPKRSG